MIPATTNQPLRSSGTSLKVVLKQRTKTSGKAAFSLYVRTLHGPDLPEELRTAKSVADIPPVPKGPVVSHTLIEAPRGLQILYNIPNTGYVLFFFL